MTDAQHHRLRTHLEHRRLELRRSLELKLREVRAHDGHAEKSVIGLDEADAADADLQQELLVTMTELTSDTLRRVDAALVRLAHGEYGTCIDCGEDIAVQRLVALPFALRCLDCETQREQASRQSASAGARWSAAVLASDEGSGAVSPVG